jgi:hypothetical protein
MPTTKAELLRNLGCTRNSFFYLHYATAVTTHFAEAVKDGRTTHDYGAFDGPRPGVPSFREFLMNMERYAKQHDRTFEQELTWVHQDARGTSMRAYQHEVFEHIKAYANRTKQFELFRQQPWYQFARIVRNSFGHDWTIQSNVLKEGDVADFAGLRITAADDGKPMKELGIGFDHFRQLAETMIQFAEKDLKDSA